MAQDAIRFHRFFHFFITFGLFLLTDAAVAAAYIILARGLRGAERRRGGCRRNFTYVWVIRDQTVDTGAAGIPDDMNGGRCTHRRWGINWMERVRAARRN